MANDNDVASDREVLERELSIRSITERQQQPPKFDKHGERICLDCEGFIPHPRVSVVDAVRCVNCQEQQEINNRNYP